MKPMTPRATGRLGLLCLNLALVASVHAQQPTDAPLIQASPAGSQQAPTSASATDAGLSAGVPADKIEELVAPIALYPDVLVSQILPASTFPVDIVKAARWLRSKPEMSTLAGQQWDLSVLSLCHYPDVIDKMDQDLDWTSALGATFLAQPRDVMDAIQRLRRRAQGNGALKTTEQQTVVVEQQTIRIVPSQPQVVYVPTYNPQTVYVVGNGSDNAAAAAVTAGTIGFGVGLAMGTWLHHDCDWYGGGVVYCKPGYWGGYGYRGAVAWNDDWVAAVGPRRAAIVGENGGAYVGPRGAAAWGENGHAAAWRRPNAHAAPAYSGRYASYRSYAGNTAYRGNSAIGNDVSFNRNTMSFDRGDRNAAIGGDRNTSIGAGRTPAAGADRPGTGQPRAPTQLPASGSAFSGGLGSDSRSFSQRGLQSRQAASSPLPARGQTATPRAAPSPLPARSPGTAQWPSAGSTSAGRSSYTSGARPSAQPSARSPSRPSSFASYGGSSQIRSYDTRGSASRSAAGISRSSGGFRGGGGRGRR